MSDHEASTGTDPDETETDSDNDRATPAPPVVEHVERPRQAVAAVTTPVVQTPVVQTPVVTTPVIKTPVVKTPVVKTPVVAKRWAHLFERVRKVRLEDHVPSKSGLLARDVQQQRYQELVADQLATKQMKTRYARDEAKDKMRTRDIAAQKQDLLLRHEKNEQRVLDAATAAIQDSRDRDARFQERVRIRRLALLDLAANRDARTRFLAEQFTYNGDANDLRTQGRAQIDTARLAEQQQELEARFRFHGDAAAMRLHQTGTMRPKSAP
jgi:hypothetical protein